MRRADWLRWGLRACVALPIALLLFNLLAWLRWGLDLPFFDDWRAYDDGVAGSLALRDLFAGANNTIAPVGLALDALAQRGLGGNALPYQSLSMIIVLGGLLWLQWRLLGRVARDRILQPLAFAFCFPMLQPGTYWGEQNLAYHQALPLLALLAVVLLTLRPARRPACHLAAVCFLGLAAGLSYISGAVAALVLGAAWVVLAWMLRRRALMTDLARRLHASAAMLLLAGAATLSLQVYLTRFIPQQRRPYAEITWPDGPDFWAYFAGKFGRASGPAFAWPAAEVTWVALLAVLFVVAAALSLRAVVAAGAATSHQARRRRLALVLLPLGAVVGAYLAMIAMGRAGLRGDSVTGAAAVFHLAYERFHYFWVTPLFPWIALALALGARRLPRARGALAAALVLACAAGWVRGTFDIWPYYRAQSGDRTATLLCMARQLGTGQPVQCSGYQHMGLPDLTRAYLNARAVDAAFTRSLPVVAHADLGQDVLRGDASSDAVRWHNAEPAGAGWMRSAGDPQMLISLAGEHGALAGCRIVGFEVHLQTPGPEFAQLFYLPAGQADFTEAASQYIDYRPAPDGRVQLAFSIDARAGLEPRLRFDPVVGPGHWRIDDWRVSCLLHEPK